MLAAVLLVAVLLAALPPAASPAMAGLILEPQPTLAPPIRPQRDPSASEALYARTHDSRACHRPGRIDPRLTNPAAGPLARMSLKARDAIIAFYRDRAMQPAWACADGSLQRAIAVRDAFADAWRHGLEPDFYFTDHMRGLLAARSADDLADLDVHLTASLLLYASHVVRGRRVPDRRQAEGFLPGLLDDRVGMLQRLAAADNLRGAIAALIPGDPAYDRMRRTLALYRGIARNGGWPRVPDGDGLLRPGDIDPRVPALRMRLRVSGDADAVAGLPLPAGPPTSDPAIPDPPASGSPASGLPAPDSPTPGDRSASGRTGGNPAPAGGAVVAPEHPAPPLTRGTAVSACVSMPVPCQARPGTTAPALLSDSYDSRLELAVRHFQTRHGLAVDGIVGPNTLAQLNVTATSRADQLALNMERMRWRATRPARRIEVNIPDFTLAVIEDGRTTLSMKVIVGRTARQTPLIASTLRHLVLNPYWNVPHLIARKDIAGAMTRDPAYVTDRGIRVLTGWGDTARRVAPADVDWGKAAQSGYFPYRLRQDPGPRNSLGRIKFMMPNRHAIYLHDTPDRHLFDRDRRSYSSGCIRVEDPTALALHLLAGGTGKPWTRQRLAAAIARGHNQPVALPQAMPVYLDYITAWVHRDGHTVQFRDDLYRRDRPLAIALAKATPGSQATQISAR